MLSKENKLIKIALVDDEKDFLRISEAYLKKQNENYHILSFQSPISFLNYLQEKKKDQIDVIISDYDMPEMNGLELLKETRMITNAPFIMVTGKGRDEIVIDALNNGITYYLEKSIDPISLYAELHHYILTAYEKRLIEKELIETKELNMSLVNMSRAGIIIHVNGIIQFCNSTVLRILEYEEKNIIGTNLLDFVYNGFKAKVRKRMKQVLNGIDIPFKKLKIIKANGEIIVVETTARLIHYKGEKGLIAYVRF